MIKKLESLTNREREVFCLLAKGESSQVLAQRIGIRPRTVQKHLQRIYEKLGLKGRTAAAVVAVRFAEQTERESTTRLTAEIEMRSREVGTVEYKYY